MDGDTSSTLERVNDMRQTPSLTSEAYLGRLAVQPERELAWAYQPWALPGSSNSQVMAETAVAEKIVPVMPMNAVAIRSTFRAMVTVLRGIATAAR
jgi:hypothetical protein